MVWVKQNLTEASKTENSPVTKTFLQNLGGLRSYLSHFFHSKHDIDDVLQDAYVRAVQAEKVEEIQTPKAFLYKICKNLAINHHTKAAQRLTDYIADFDDLEVLYSTVSMDEQVEQENRFVQFCESVKCLPPQCRRAFVLKKVYGLSSKEVAQRLGITISTVDKHLARGLVICRNHLERKGYSFNSKPSATGKRTQ